MRMRRNHLSVTNSQQISNDLDSHLDKYDIFETNRNKRKISIPFRYRIYYVVQLNGSKPTFYLSIWMGDGKRESDFCK